jgi:hypothetical protein
MNEIKIYLNISNVRFNKRIRINKAIELNYEIRTLKKESNQILINYLTKYPIFSSKYLEYINWKEIYNIKVNKENNTIEGTNRLVLLKSSKNNKRTYFNWDHLNNFWVI